MDDFEVSRRERETQNEKAINRIFCGLLGLSLAVQGVFFLLPEAYRPEASALTPVGLLVSQTVVLLVAILLELYLRRSPPYYSYRKYLISSAEAVAATAIVLTADIPGFESFALIVSIPVFMLLLVVSGLRYSTRIVVFTGAIAIALFLLLTLLGPRLAIRQAVIETGVFFLAGTTLVMALVVSSLLRLHGESVSKERLGRFFAPEVVDQIVRTPEVTLGAVERQVTVLFSDISGFTKLSSTMKPGEVVQLLNDYFPAMADIVFRHGGTLEKYIGDALLAVWGAPLAMDDAADRAVAAAVEMQEAVVKLDRGFHIHVGLHTGRVAAGHIGTDAYLQYACIGDTTNVSSRICDVAQARQIVISEATYSKLCRHNLTVVPLPPAPVKGKAQPLKLYQVLWDGG